MAKGFLIPAVIDSSSASSASMNFMNHSDDRNNSCIRLNLCCCGLVWRPVASLLKHSSFFFKATTTTWESDSLKLTNEWNWLKNCNCSPKGTISSCAKPTTTRRWRSPPTSAAAVALLWRAEAESMLSTMWSVCGCDPPSLQLLVFLPQPSRSRFSLPLPLCPSLPTSLVPSLSSPLLSPKTASLSSSQSSSKINYNHCRVTSICRAALQCHFKVITACTWVIITTLSDTELTHPQGQTWASLVHPGPDQRLSFLTGYVKGPLAKPKPKKKQKLHPDLHDCACSADSLAAVRSAWRRKCDLWVAFS